MRLIDPQGRRLYLTGEERTAFMAAARKAAREVRTFCAVGRAGVAAPRQIARRKPPPAADARALAPATFVERVARQADDQTLEKMAKRIRGWVFWRRGGSL